MEIKNTSQTINFSLFCWNIANPSFERAAKQAEWLRKRPEDVLVLTEAKQSKGCVLLERYFQAYGYNVVFPKPEEKEFGVIIVSKHPISSSSFSNYIDFLRSRVVSIKLSFSSGELEIIGVYVHAVYFIRTIKKITKRIPLEVKLKIRSVFQIIDEVFGY